MKLALPVWEGRIAPLFDVARCFLLVEYDGGRELAREEMIVWNSAPQGWEDYLKDLEVDVLICGGISRPLFEQVQATGIEVVPWIKGVVGQVLTAHVEGRLGAMRFAMPGTRCG